MRNKISGGIGILWGGAILLNWLISGSPGGSAAYEGGRATAALFGLVLLGAGLYYFFKKPDQA